MNIYNTFFPARVRWLLVDGHASPICVLRSKRNRRITFQFSHWACSTFQRFALSRAWNTNKTVWKHKYRLLDRRKGSVISVCALDVERGPVFFVLNSTLCKQVGICTCEYSAWAGVDREMRIDLFLHAGERENGTDKSAVCVCVCVANGLWKRIWNYTVVFRQFSRKMTTICPAVFRAVFAVGLFEYDSNDRI